MRSILSTLRKRILPRLLTVALIGAAAMPAHADDRSDKQAELIARLVPTVVSITTISYETLPPQGKAMQVTKQTADENKSRKSLVGSGFIVHSSGYIVTNKHVVDGGSEFLVTFADGSRVRAELVAEAVDVDIAVIKVTMDRALPAVTIGDSDTLRQGDPVIAIGNPLGFSSSVSTGVVSALDRNIESSPYDDYIQTDAPINHGNSGGPLFNEQGQVIGIASAIYATSDTGGSIGIGFAIPSNDARFVVQQLLDFHSIEPGWLGADIQPVTAEIANALGLPSPAGALVSSVLPNSPADQAGLQSGDLVLSFDGRIQANARALRRVIEMTPANTTVPLGVVRQGRAMAVSVKLTLSPQNSKFVRIAADPAHITPPRPMPVDLGLQLAPVDPATRREFRLRADSNGLVVTKVSEGSTAAMHGLKPGDMVLKLHDGPVTSLAEFRAGIDRARKDGRNFALVMVQSGTATRWVPLHIESF